MNFLRQIIKFSRTPRIVIFAIMLGCGFITVSVKQVRAAAEEAVLVKKITVVGNTYTKADTIKYRMRTREGKKLNPRVLDEDFKRLWKMGSFSDVQIHKEKVDGGVILRVVVKEKSVIRRLAFRGNTQVKAKSLKKLITSAVGQNYDPGIVNRDVRAIADWYREEYYYFTNVEAKTEAFEDGVRLVFVISERGRVAIKKIIFKGNNSMRDKELLQHMATKPSSLFSRGKYDREIFKQDLERLRILYQSKGFLDVQVKEKPFQITSRQAKNKWKQQQLYLNVEILEGEKYHIGKISFKVKPVGKQSVYRDEDLLAVITLMPGQVYSPIAAAKDARKLRDFYGKKGRIFTNVRPERVLADEGTTVDLVFNIRESKKIILEDVVITGLVKTKEEVVRREIEIFPGDVFDSTKMEQSVRNLNRLDFFERPIAWDVKNGSQSDHSKVVMELKEKPTGQLSFGVGVSSADGVVGSVSVKQRNFDRSNRPKNFKDLISGKGFTGAGEYFSASLKMGSETSEGSVDYLDPWVFNRPLRFGTGVYYRNREWSSYNESRGGVYFLLGQHVFGKNWDLTLRYRLEQVSIKNLDDSVSSELSKEEGNNWVSSIEHRLTYDTRDDIFQPASGWYAFASYQLAGGPFGGTKNFWRAHTQVNYFYTFYKDARKRPHVLAFRGEVGLAEAFGSSSEVPLYDRWFAGGIGSLRGFDFHTISPQSLSGDSIGGGNMTTASTEYFFPILSKVVRGSIYYDIGGVRLGQGEWTGETRSSYGFGLHLQTPLGPMPVRIYYNKPLQVQEGDNTSSIQFTFGAFF